MIEPILITGCARSGTSMTAGIINQAGAWGGDMYPAQKENKKGMFENITFRDRLVKPFIKSIGADPMAQNPLPDIDSCKLVSEQAVDNWRQIVLHEIRHQGYKSGPWFYKDPKMCIIWPVWARAFPNARWIIVRRASGDIVRSCLKTRFMRAYADEIGWLKWVDHHKECFLQMSHAGLNIQYAWPQEWIDRDYTGIRAILIRLGLEYDKNKIESFIEPALWSNK